jgi:hypothetical protein
MKYLFNLHGVHIANGVDDQLYTDKGLHIGCFLKDYEIFIDLKGQYLGEIIFDNRLLFKSDSIYKNFCFGNYLKFNSIEYLGTPGFLGIIAQPSCYENVEF